MPRRFSVTLSAHKFDEVSAVATLAGFTGKRRVPQFARHLLVMEAKRRQARNRNNRLADSFYAKTAL